MGKNRVFLSHFLLSITYYLFLLLSFPFSSKIISGAGVTQLVECKLPKLDAAGSSPVARSNYTIYHSLDILSRLQLSFRQDVFQRNIATLPGTSKRRFLSYE